jgi:hypothetical protein
MVQYKKSPKSWRVVNSATDPYIGVGYLARKWIRISLIRGWLS